MIGSGSVFAIVCFPLTTGIAKTPNHMRKIRDGLGLDSQGFPHRIKGTAVPFILLLRQKLTRRDRPREHRHDPSHKLIETVLELLDVAETILLGHRAGNLQAVLCHTDKPVTLLVREVAEALEPEIVSHDRYS